MFLTKIVKDTNNGYGMNKRRIVLTRNIDRNRQIDDYLKHKLWFPEGRVW